MEHDISLASLDYILKQPFCLKKKLLCVCLFICVLMGFIIELNHNCPALSQTKIWT